MFFYLAQRFGVRKLQSFYAGVLGGGGVQLTSRNGILANMRSSKEQGQSNFTNPGLRMIGAGFDSDLAPKVRLSGNFNYFWFEVR